MGWFGKKKLSDLIVQLKTFTKMLEIERRRVERESGKNRELAKKHRMEGRNEEAKVYAMHAAKYRKWAFLLDKYRLSIDSTVLQLQQAEMVGNVTKILGKVSVSLRSIQRLLSMPQLVKMNQELQTQLSGLSISTEMAQEGLEGLGDTVEVSEAEINDVMKDIDAEIGITTSAAIPSASSASPEVEKLKGDIERLKKEVEE